ncbi:MAG TPA: hypothetical protein DEB09_00435 [Candidatus Magasanikbacteria bacterium]|nr:hypothetical protein [Candidatus Magasanikbacteria bacterium]
MQDLQAIFNRLQEAKKKQKDIKASYKEALKNSSSYTDLVDELKTLRAKKKEIEEAVRRDFGSEFTKLEDLKIDIESDTELITDIAITQLMKGESIAIKDEDGKDYEPVFKVNFKKVA